MVELIDSLFNVFFPSYVFDLETVFSVPLYFLFLVLFFGLFIRFFRGLL